MIYPIIIFGSLIVAGYMIMIISLIIGWKRLVDASVSPTSVQVAVSIIVAFKNEQDNLVALIESIMDQIFPVDKFELILVDDHSADSGISIIREYQKKYTNIRLLELDNSHVGKKAAVAAGISEAKHSLIVSTDADCTPSPGWLDRISKSCSEDVLLAIGPVLMSSDNSFSHNLQSLEYASLMAVAAGSAGIGHPVIASAANMVFSKDNLDIKYTTLSPGIKSGDDMFLLHQAKRAGRGKIIFIKSTDAIVTTKPPDDIIKGYQQRRRWASKAPFYKDPDTITAGMIVLLICITMLASLIITVFHPAFLLFFGCVFIIKSVFDYILLRKFLLFFGQTRLLKVFIPLQVVYPFYIVMAFFTGILKQTSWK